MLGCIPRSPSPDPNIDLTTRSQPSSSVSVKEELTTLRARLAELERQANSTPEPTLKPESKRAISAIKREMGDKQNQRSAKRSRQSGPIETIDLTDD
ncbi:MAG: hypothetical protein LQ346_000613 [Caloplaca aetnensis]|nr:MAG: hypothetical protein LQ346_000613 [Caloplaca aetnensis]